MDYIGERERALRRSANELCLLMQDDDARATFASADLLKRSTGTSC